MLYININYLFDHTKHRNMGITNETTSLTGINGKMPNNVYKFNIEYLRMFGLLAGSKLRYCSVTHQYFSSITFEYIRFSTILFASFLLQWSCYLLGRQQQFCLTNIQLPMNRLTRPGKYYSREQSPTSMKRRPTFGTPSITSILAFSLTTIQQRRLRHSSSSLL